MTYVKMLLTDRNGERRDNLTGIKWSWFDETTPNTFNAPPDQGSAETTAAAGIINITLTGTALVSGQAGRCALTTTDNINTGIYKLRIK